MVEIEVEVEFYIRVKCKIALECELVESSMKSVKSTRLSKDSLT